MLKWAHYNNSATPSVEEAGFQLTNFPESTFQNQFYNRFHFNKVTQLSSFLRNVSSALMSICFKFLRTTGNPKSFIEFCSTSVFLHGEKCYLIKMTTTQNRFYVVWIVSLQFHTNYIAKTEWPTDRTTPTFIHLNTEVISIRVGIYFTFSYLNLSFLE